MIAIVIEWEANDAKTRAKSYRCYFPGFPCLLCPRLGKTHSAGSAFLANQHGPESPVESETEPADCSGDPWNKTVHFLSGIWGGTMYRLNGKINIKTLLFQSQNPYFPDERFYFIFCITWRVGGRQAHNSFSQRPCCFHSWGFGRSRVRLVS